MIVADPIKTLNEWITKRIRVPVVSHDFNFKENPSFVDVSANICELREIADPIIKRLIKLNKIEEDLLFCITNSGQLEWSRAIKRELLERYFPDKIKNIPYHSGGDLIK